MLHVLDAADLHRRKLPTSNQHSYPSSAHAQVTRGVRLTPKVHTPSCNHSHHLLPEISKHTHSNRPAHTRRSSIQKLSHFRENRPSPQRPQRHPADQL